MFGKWLHKVCQRLDVALLYPTSTGIKCVNRPPYSERLSQLAGTEIIELTPGELRLGFDALKDEFTLMGVALTASPHVELMKLFAANASAEASDYVRRLRAGSLDLRAARRVTARHLLERREKFLQARARMESGPVEPVKIIRLAGANYIADGKHRAAVSALLGRPVRCVEATPAVYDSFNWWVWRKMEKTPERYQKHLRWFEAAAARNPVA